MVDFPVAQGPWGVAFDGANIWVANWGSNTVSKRWPCRLKLMKLSGVATARVNAAAGPGHQPGPVTAAVPGRGLLAARQGFPSGGVRVRCADYTPLILTCRSAD